MRSAVMALLGLLLPLAAIAAQVSLRDLPALARSRAERLRPAQEKALEPFWADLALDYDRDNAQFLDGRIAAVAALGDSVVPLLLEKLQPLGGTAASRHLAANCRRVLERLDPGGFVDALIELTGSGNETARLEATRLLGRSGSPRAVPTLSRLLAEGRSGETVPVLEALAQLRDASVAAQVAPILGSADRLIRSAALDYLVAAKAEDGLPLAIQALSTESDRVLLPKYVEYLAAVTRENDAVARALLPLLERERLDWRDTRRLVQVLATIAPKGHDPTLRRLHDLLDTGDTGPLGLEAATTLRALGDKQGLKQLLATINDQMRRRKQEPQIYEDRANLHFANGDYKDAVDDYERVVELSNSPMLQRRVQLLIVRCEARRSRFDKVLKHVKDAALTAEELTALAEEDPAVHDALQKPAMRAWLQAQKDGRGGK